MRLLKELGAMITSLHLSRGRSLEEMASVCGVSAACLALVEAGDIDVSTLTLAAILNALGLTLFASFRSG
jgi:predicted transcriptional regulator